jgi:hypothetical protein
MHDLENQPCHYPSTATLPAAVSYLAFYAVEQSDADCLTFLAGPLTSS